MEALGSTLGIQVSSGTNITRRQYGLSTLRSPSQSVVSSCSIPYWELSLEKSCFASKLASHKAERSKGDFECRNTIQENKSSVETEDGSGTPLRRKRLAVFVSGGGSNFRAIHEATVEGSVYGHVTVLVTDKPSCGGAEHARDNEIPVILFPKSKSTPEGLSPVDLVSTLRNFEVDFILLAGFLKLIPVELVRAYPRSILNIHPSLLPAFGGKGFYGLKVHKAVIASGARYSGPTVHFVDEHYDTGRILAQRVVPVLANDTAEQLAARVLQLEHRIYVEVVSALCEERIIWREDGVPLIRSKENPNGYY
ncbi:phosphoribosylglycinamide formyltransferase, chloroplastic [Phoenix dactylifera]|uniref:Phosphoribosylglycinamide formyltransferase, chloroplastic n=1 Tax=Phoenix dactylifera TaxID=42345 RepID=A0A8B9A8N3_PHODC|nr:phosphoribosylglycinamide formyltransferase, chloroplastic [Phoenix dactylifera]XP_008799340.1 phosphoribosylglycinamide formyltransferase, chloroplastic [Phoenix dactylifera]XP_008799341.1 phosphoribosylglycinamide formyltransferase, chloroplastic [Phoenix dactylifera]XP_008799342.1 phosphoribosylglycinamide formyltransferase, chloroplastic [Phoenix dactylifera]XP_038983005.1 phosphoribosylglycinamide formyltransferase, chloroplastic [Phoenix dactylifera]XP_038983006.1 phosphoribosylglycin